MLYASDRQIREKHLEVKSVATSLFLFFSSNLISHPPPSLGGPGGAGPGQEGQDVYCCGPPPVHHPKRRPHRCLPGRGGGRTGDTSKAAGHEGSLLHTGHLTDGLWEGMKESGEDVF